MEKEIWKPIECYGGYYKGSYEVSNLGKVRSVERYVKQGNIFRRVKEKVKKEVLNTSGYPCVGLSKDRKTRLIPIHILIANAFIPNPDDKNEIDHINTDIKDYSIENLRWVSHKENMNNPITKRRIYIKSHSKEALIKSIKTKIRNGGQTSPKTVYQFDINGTYINKFESARDANRNTGVDASSINECCLMKKHSAGGFLWSRTNTAPVYEPYKLKRKKIVQKDLNGNILKVWESVSEAAGTLKIQISNIVRCAKGKTTRKICGGYKWEYVNV